MSFPFTKPTEENVAPQAAAPTADPAQAAPQAAAPTADPAQAAPQAAPAAAEKPKKKHNRQATKEITPEDIDFVLKNVRTMSYNDMAEACGLTKFQVNRILMEIKKGIREKAKGNEAAEMAAEKFIKENLSRPEDSGPGKGGGKVKNALNTAVDNIIGNLLS